MARQSWVAKGSMAALLAAAVSSAAGAGIVGFEEDFALAPDRTAALKQLIPGTEDYYYYTALELQNQGKLDDVDKTLESWIKQHNRTGRVVEMERRQALLKYGKAPKESLAYLSRELGLYFGHQRETQERQAALPTELDPKTVTREKWTERALAQNPQTLGGFEDAAIEKVLESEKLTEERMHEALSRLQRPDVPKLVSYIAGDMGSTRYRTSFGSLPIHNLLLLDQLDDLLKTRPQILNDRNFVNAYISRLRPAVGVDWRHDPVEEGKYLDRVQAFVAKLGPVHNSLKAHVLYQRLAFDRKQGKWDKALFMEYLKLPRQVFYINPKYLEPVARRENQVNLSADYSQATLLPPINNDEPLVRSYLLQLLVDAQDYAEYNPLIEENYLKSVFAEAKLTAGVGDAEKWYAMLGATQLQALKERVDLDFAYTNKELFAPDDAVKIDVNVKNVKTLIVKVYEVNAANYYKTFGRDVTTDINLDGLVANEERTVEYKDPPLLRVQRPFEFKNLDKRGVYVVELIGNGKSSRALIRKGKLRYVESRDASGHVFKVLDEANTLVKDARIWLGNHEYEADKDGEIAVPYSTAPGNQPVVLMAGGFASLDHFTHMGEAYRFTAGMHVPAESLVRYGVAKVAVRPALFVNDVQISPRFLKDATMVITSVDADGISTSKEVSNCAIYEDRDSEVEFAVPDRLRSINFLLRAKIENIANNRKDDVAFGKTFQVNAIDATDKIEDIHFNRDNGVYYLDVLGKNGELRGDRAVNVDIKHKDFREIIHVSLKTDPKGRIKLGTLEDIASITATGPEGTAHTFAPMRDERTYTAALHGLEGDVLRVPYMGKEKEATGAMVSLLELRDGGTFVADWSKAVTITDGFLEIKGLPAGDYSLLLKESNVPMTLRVAKGKVSDGWVLSERRYLQLVNTNPLQIISAAADADKLTIKLANAGKNARVHVFATRFVPETSPDADMNAGTTPTVYMRTLTPQESAYESGRTIGDEYRYIIDRKYATKYPGVMLDRPGLLLNPWAIRNTDTAVQEAALGTAYGAKGGGGMGGGGGMAAPSVTGRTMHGGELTTNVDFLAEPAVEVLNASPDKDGVITIDRKSLGAHHDIQIVAEDPYSTVYREMSLEQAPPKVQDYRLLVGLDPAKHFTEQREVTLMNKADKVSLSDASANLELYDSLGKVYRLYTTLHPDATMAEFSFVLNWPALKPEEKREKYSKYACHELNFFLARRDPKFFADVVKPYLKNKTDKTFMDHYLLGDDLATYMKPWAYGRLNTVERVLLAQRIDGEGPKTARAIRDRFDLLPPNMEQFNTLFSYAIKGDALEAQAGDGWRPATRPPVDAPAEVNESTAMPRGAGAAAPLTPAAPADFGGALLARGDGTVVVTGGTLRLGAAKAAGDGMKSLDSMNKEELRKYSEAADKELNGVDGFDRVSSNGDEAFKAKEPARRADRSRLYRKLDKTMELVENNYYHLPIETQVASLVNVNGLWRDYADTSAKGAGTAFLSKNLGQPTSNFTEMMFALSVIDLPFESPKHDTKRDAGSYALTAAGPVIAFHKEIKESESAAEKTPILVSQNYYRVSDRYTYVENERTDKYVTDEFLTHVVYGCQVVITNPTSSKQKLDALMQLPKGAMPVLNAQYTQGMHVELEPYQTRSIEYAFYFPQPGEFGHYPVQVAKNEKFVAGTAPTTLKVVAIPSKVDTTSWDYISQNASADEVIKFLGDNNIERLNLEKIAWRMSDGSFYKRVMPLLSDRHIYNNTLWAYSVKQDDAPNIREFLQHQDSFLAQCGAYLDSPLVKIDPVVRTSYQHMEYAPLVNARAHRLGRDRMIVNDREFQEYEQTLNVMRYHPSLTEEDKMSATYYLLLQDRVDEGLGFFSQVDVNKLDEKVQYDYFKVVGAFYTGNADAARPIVDRYADYPVDKWKKLFANVGSQLDELQGKGPVLVNNDDRNQQQNVAANTEPTFEFHVDAKQVVLNHKNIAGVKVNYYLMDLELMFSENPFLQQYGGQFSMIKPNASEDLKLEEGKATTTFAVPEKFLNSNVMVEVVAGGVTKSQAYYANSLTIALADNYGQLTVASQNGGKALPKAYVKVYAQMKNGQTKFYKDGYTDLRGKFDYTSLSTDELDNVNKFSLLVMTDTDGAIVREATPPKR
jgi:hypothetical protein